MSLQIGKYIEFALKRSTEVTALVSDRIFPVIAPQNGNPEMPYIVYASNGVTELRSKDGVDGDTNTEELLIFALDLATLELLATKVRAAMEDAFEAWNNESDETDFFIADQEMSAGAEDYDLAHDGYYMALNYTIETQ